MAHPNTPPHPDVANNATFDNSRFFGGWIVVGGGDVVALSLTETLAVEEDVASIEHDE